MLLAASFIDLVESLGQHWDGLGAGRRACLVKNALVEETAVGFSIREHIGFPWIPYTRVGPSQVFRPHLAHVSTSNEAGIMCGYCGSPVEGYAIELRRS